MSVDLLLEMAWKPGLVAGAALIGASLLRARPAVERVAVLRLGVVMLLALPLLAALMPAVRMEAPAFAAPAARAIAASPPPVVAVPARTVEPAAAPPPAAAPGRRIDPVAAALALWAAGFAVLMLRLLTGVTLLHRWTRRAEPVADARWLAALARAARERTPPVLRASPRVTSPLSWGWRPAVILLDPAALDQAGRADAVLAHEMGHVRHGDWLFLMASRLLVAVFWFNPLVWLLQRELARQSEQAADAWAARRIGRADYATALVAMAGRGRPHAALGMAAGRGELARRVIAIMNASATDGKPWRVVLALCACLGFATPLAAVELSPAAMAATLPSGRRPAAVRPDAESPATAMTPAPARPGDAAAPPAGLATAPRRDDRSLARREAEARAMEARAREMRIIAAGLDPDDRAALNADAAALLRDAAGLRAGAGEMQVEASGAVRTASGLEVDASGNLRTDVEVTTPLELRMTIPRSEAVHLREGARQMRRGAAEMEAGADDMERSIAADPSAPHAREGPARILEMRRQAADMRRQADLIDAQANRAEAPA